MVVDQCLQGRRIFVAEDEYLIAADVRETLTRAGAEVLGPVPSVLDATQVLSDPQHIDAAILDINLRGDLVFEIADSLQERGVPVIFATGYDVEALPERFADTLRLQKPLQASELTNLLEPLVNVAR